MTNHDINEGVKTMIAISHALKDELGRRPSHAEIKWRTATYFERRWPSMNRWAAMNLATRLMDVIRLTHENNQE